MNIIHECRGCGYQYELTESGGKCKYCGTVLESSLLNPTLDEILYNARNLRRVGEFKKAREEYERVIKENQAIKEAHFGLFLCDYKISDYKLEGKQVASCKCFSDRKKPVEQNKSYNFAIENSANHDIWVNVGDYIEKSRCRNIAISSCLPEYCAILLCNPNNKRDVETADQIYNVLKKRIDIFYPKVTLSKVDRADWHAYINIALSDIPVMFVVSSDDGDDLEGGELSIYYKEFGKQNDECCLIPIVPDEDSIPEDMMEDPEDAYYIEYDPDRTNIFEIVDEMSEKISVLALDFNAGLEFDRKGKYFLNDTEESPLVSPVR